MKTSEKHTAAAVHSNDLKRIVLHSLTQHPLRSLAALAFILLSIVLQVLPPLVLGKAVDTLTGNKAVSLGLALGYFALLACSGLSDAFREAMIVASGEGITHSLRTAMMNKLHRLPAAYFTAHEAGRTASLHVNDVDAIEDMFSSGIVSMFTDLGTVVSTLIVIFSRSRGLGLLLLVALPLLFAFTRHVQKRMLAAHTRNRQAAAEQSGILPETMHIIRSLHVYHGEAFAERRYDRAVQNSFQAMEQTNFYDAVYSPVIMTCSAAVIAVMMSLSGQSGAFRAFFGMSVGTAVALIAYVNSIFTPLSSIGMEIQTVQSAAAGWKRVQDYMNEDEKTPGAESAAAGESTDSEERNNAEPPAGEDGGERTPTEQPAASSASGTEEKRAREQGTAAIQIGHLSFSYDGAAPVLQDFSLTVQQGEFVTLTGRTGVGKSTLFKLLLGLYEPQAGSIRINGISPEEIPEADRRQTICCVEQKVTIVPGTIRNQITLGDDRYTEETIWKALQTAGLSETVSRLPEQLETPYKDTLFSQGQKQLLMIARAVVSNPQILLLDEITAGLDSATEKMVTEALQQAAAGRTVLSISHRLSEVVSGRIVSMI